MNVESQAEQWNIGLYLYKSLVNKKIINIQPEFKMYGFVTEDFFEEDYHLLKDCSQLMIFVLHCWTATDLNIF